MSDVASTPTPAAAAPAAESSNPAPTETPKADAKPADAEAPKEAKAEGAEAEELDGEELEESEEKELSEKEKKEAKRLWKLKVQGKDLDVDEEELIKRAQMGYSADQKWQEAAQVKKQVEQFIGMLQKDPVEALSQLGFNVDEIAEKHIQRRIEEMQKTPEQVEREKLQREVEELRKKEKEREQKAQELEKQRLQEKFAIEFEQDILSSLDDPKSGLPKSPYFIKRVADTMIFAMQNGYKDIKAKDAIAIIKDEVRKELHEMYQASPDEVFEELVGKDRLTKYRKAKIKNKKTVPNADIKPTGQAEMKAEKAKQEQEQKKIRQRDFFKNLGTK